MWSRCKVTEIFIGSEFTTRRPGRSKSLGEFFEKRSVKGLDPKIWISKWVPFCCHWWILTACFPAISKLWSLLFIINLLVTSYSKSIAPLDYQLRHENLSSVVFCGSEPEFQRWHPIKVTNFYSPSSPPVILVVSKANPKDLLNSNSSLSTRDFQGQEVRDSNKADPCATFLEQEFRTKNWKSDI